MTDAVFAIVLVEGKATAAQKTKLQKHFAATRVITDTSDVQNGDLLVLETVPEAWNDATHRPWWACTNVLLLDGNRAPMVRRMTLADALAEA